MPLASDIQLPERYRVTRHIASGGMASVWEVEDLLLGRVVAVKVLGAQYAADLGARARFAREARTAARVCEHPHIATIYDIGEHGEEAFIVMEYFSGGTVADQLRAASEAGRRVPRETALRWLREAAGGLDHAHGAGVVHRDVKPANLLLDAQTRLAVADFGIARLADDTHMTQTGQLLGTAAYLSPEQALGGQATAASDRYAFAVVAYELLTGTRPFPGGPPTAQLRQHAEAQPARASEAAPDLPAAIDAVLSRGLAKSPQDRPRTAAELVGEIERALRAPEPTEKTQRLAPVLPLAAEAAPAARAPDPPPAPSRISPLAALALVAVVAGIVIALVLAGGDSERRASTSIPRTTQPAGERTPTPAPAPAGDAEEPAQEPSAGAEEDPSPAADPVALNARGNDLINAGDYAAAVPVLEQAVAGFREQKRTDEIQYAYALYNLAFALTRSGDPEAAIPLLEERLKYDDQLATVRKELAYAKSQLDGGDETKEPEDEKGGKPGKRGKRDKDD